MSRITATYAFDGTGYIEGCHVRVIEQVNVHGERSEHVVLETRQESSDRSRSVRAVPIGREREEG